jgi:hypothetical protein
MGELKHDDGCRCLACCREKFKTIDPAQIGRAPRLRKSCWWPVLPED